MNPEQMLVFVLVGLFVASGKPLQWSIQQCPVEWRGQSSLACGTSSQSLAYFATCRRASAARNMMSWL